MADVWRRMAGWYHSGDVLPRPHGEAMLMGDNGLIHIGVDGRVTTIGDDPVFVIGGYAGIPG